MRVAICAPVKAPTAPSPSGDRRIARLMMAALAHRGHDAELVSRFSSRDRSGDANRQARLAELGRQLAARLIGQIRKRPAATRPRAWLTYHLYHKAPDWLGPAVTTALGIPYYLAEASSAPKQGRGPWQTGFSAANSAIRHAERILVLNPDDRPCLLPLVDDPKRLTPLSPFLDHQPFATAYQARKKHRAELRRLLGLAGDRTVILAVGMMRGGDKQASYDVLGQTLSLLTDEEWDLLIVGDGPKRYEIMQGFAGLPVKRVHAIGARRPEDLPSLYAAADLLVWPGVREAIGMSILEAQATGLPVVSGKTGAIPNIVEPTETGFLCPVGQAEPLAAGVRRLLRNPELRRAMGKAAIGKVARQHTVGHAANTISTMLRSGI